MNARELSKKWRVERLAWENKAIIEGRAGGSEWAVYENPYWDSPQYEWRVKLEPRPLIHFALFPGAQAICGSQQWSKGGDGIGTEWPQVTCPECRKRRPKAEIQPPEGYRLLRDDEPLLPLDMGHCPRQNSWITVSERATAFDAFARKFPEGKPGQPITAASEPTSREDLVRQRNWAVDEAKRLKADLEVCQTNLEIVRQDRDRLCMCQAQATAPRPPLPDLNELYKTVGANMSREQWGAAIHRLRFAISQIIKHLRP
jgi:hypothetical protein